MIKYISLENSKTYLLPALTDGEAKSRSIDEKGWSYSNVYGLRELKDVFLIICKNPGKPNKEIIEQVHKHITPETKDWDFKGRKALEHINALKNFQAVDLDNFPTKEYFRGSNINQELSASDREIMKAIFFEYFRFQEIISWFIDPAKEDRMSIHSKISEKYVSDFSKPVFFFPYQSRFVDTFIYELKDCPDIYIIDPKMSHLKRFWDVFTKWGVTLGLLERFSLLHSSYKIRDYENSIKDKEISCAYFVSNEQNVDLIDFLVGSNKSKHIYLPEAILQICFHFRIPVEVVKELIVKQAVASKQFIGFDRTSEIFVKVRDFNKKKQETIFFPKYKDSFISHLNLK